MADSIADVSLVNNREERTPIVVLLDCLNHRDAEGIQLLNNALKVFEAELKNDPVAAKRCRVRVIGFANGDVSGSEWLDAENFVAPVFEPLPYVPVDEGNSSSGLVTVVLKEIEEQEKKLRAAGVSYKRPIFIFISDGEFLSGDGWEEDAAACLAAETTGKVTVWVVDTGRTTSFLDKFSKEGAKALNGAPHYSQLFSWLSSSVRAVSHAVKGEVAQLPTTDSWAMTRAMAVTNRAAAQLGGFIGRFF